MCLAISWLMMKLHELSNTICCFSWLMLKIHEPRPLVKVNCARMLKIFIHVYLKTYLNGWNSSCNYKFLKLALKIKMFVLQFPGWCWNYMSLAIMYVAFPGWCWNYTSLDLLLKWIKQECALKFLIYEYLKTWLNGWYSTCK